ncbi:MAG TPA: hypothetical protein VGX78_09600, partial [Pirellulales bacterium]|nr:hypothetical protein [Pirellulales bacterium]
TPRTSRPWYRLHVVTCVVLFIVAVPTALANLSPSDETSNDNTWDAEIEHGWPFVWYWKSASLPFVVTVIPVLKYVFHFSAGRLAINAFLWTAGLVATAVASEALLRRFQPRFRWSLRTMMTAIGLMTVGCACYAALRNRAAVQDPLIAELEEWGEVCLERWGPRWLDLVGADRLRRRIVGARLDEADEKGVELLTRLADLPDVRWLDLTGARLTPAANMKELRVLVVHGAVKDDRDLASLAGLIRLEILDLSNSRITDDGLTHLAGLHNLESLYLANTDVRGPGVGNLASLEKLRVLDLSGLGASIVEFLPLLPQLEALNLSRGHVVQAARSVVVGVSNCKQPRRAGTGLPTPSHSARAARSHRPRERPFVQVA